jgi:transposase-like protein
MIFAVSDDHPGLKRAIREVLPEAASFPTRKGALRLIRALADEIHEDWNEAHRYLNMEMRREQRKQLQLLETA